jgi:hypothetical protein
LAAKETSGADIDVPDIIVGLGVCVATSHPKTGTLHPGAARSTYSWLKFAKLEYLLSASTEPTVMTFGDAAPPPFGGDDVGLPAEIVALRIAVPCCEYVKHVTVLNDAVLRVSSTARRFEAEAELRDNYGACGLLRCLNGGGKLGAAIERIRSLAAFMLLERRGEPIAFAALAQKERADLGADKGGFKSG